MSQIVAYAKAVLKPYFPGVGLGKIALGQPPTQPRRGPGRRRNRGDEGPGLKAAGTLFGVRGPGPAFP